MTNSLLERAVYRLRREGRRIQQKIDDRLVQVNEHSAAVQRLTGQQDELNSSGSQNLLPVTGASLTSSTQWRDIKQRDALERARQALTLVLEDGPAYAELWTGPEQVTGRTLRVAYLSDQRAYKVNSPQYLRHILYQSERVRVESRGDYSRTQPRPKAEALAGEADLIIFEGNNLRGWRPDRGAWRWTPTWLRMMWHFRPDMIWEEVEDCMHGQKTNIKRVKKRQYRSRFSIDEADFDFFYERMHKPMMAARHTNYGYVDRKESLHEQFRLGGLFLVYTPDDQAVAGGLFKFQSHSAFATANGILDGNQRWNEEGAVSALYFHSIRWCFDNGLACYDSGGVRPFANDGLYQYKMRWGLQPTNDLWNEQRWLFWAPTCAPAAMDWLAAHPPVTFNTAADGASPDHLIVDEPGRCSQDALTTKSAR